MTPRALGNSYIGAIDPGTRGPLWTVLVMTADREGGRVVTHHQQWEPAPGAAAPLRQTLEEIATICRAYIHPPILSLAQNLRRPPPPPLARAGSLAGFIADQYVSKELREVARLVGVPIHTRDITDRQWLDWFVSLRVLVEEGRLVIPNDANIRDDLLNVSRKLVQAGPRIDLPLGQTGRHADYARLLAMCCAEPCRSAPSPPKPADQEAELLASIEGRARTPGLFGKYRGDLGHGEPGIWHKRR